ncbi:beta-N-acetylglucosaminidase [Patiriisocius marinistellae]|uniref:beta-N-acetylhexosaminidase n=1 Tax=Patiriisocius marinistellae TaxID=2494560 RepID=A0A5J4FZ59_9FLAO|nr:glycoside hydrolase family 3 N-terminal domain-containing protein [Patiriisocius marinistellae]GEQ86464.1 beta-N-acetylglucosaminidase [Patiriisocius marinistellae]
MIKYFAPFIFLLFNISANAQQLNPLIVGDDVVKQQQWVDSIYDNMAIEEKVGQLFMVDAFSSDPKSKTDKIKALIKNQHIGGVIFSKGGPKRQAKLNNEFQAISKVPLMIGMDAEWGLAMRLDSTYAYPWNMTLGAITDNDIVKSVGRRIGEHSRRMGVHINFAPVVDINTNPKNPIIGNRSFGEDRDNVTEKSLAFMEGMQSAGVLASAKHFPGHGDTDSDSHKTLPTINFTKQRIDSIELYPYKRLIRDGLASVMVAHLNVPSLEQKDGLPSSISKTIVTDMLKGQLGFNGLIFTDALNMKGVSNFKKPGEIDLAAFMAGNDVLLISEDIPKAHALLVNAYREQVITEERLALSVKKILMAKYMVGLNNYTPVQEFFIVEDLNSVVDDVLYERAMENAITVLKNDSLILPIKNVANKKIAYINFGDDDGKPFLKYLRKYAKIDYVKADNLDSYVKKLSKYDYVIAGFHKSNDNPWKDFKFTNRELAWLQEIARTNTLILDVFARPYAMLDLKTSTNIEGVIMSYQNSEVSQSLSAQLIFGARAANGKLPVSLGEDFPLNTQIKTNEVKKLTYGTPESVGLSSYKLKKIDSLANGGLWAGMMPGAQILVARKGKVVYSKNFGYHTQSKKNSVKDDDLYDVASLTKILASLPVVMELVDRGALSMDTKLSEMLPEYKGTDKANITLRRMLTHTARLKAWIPYYVKTMDTATKKPMTKWYEKEYSREFPYKVANDLYMKKEYKDSVYLQIKESELRSRAGYKYSDLPYYLVMKYLEEFFDSKLEDIVQRDFYEPLGANYTTYNPLEKFNKADIVPTEVDDYFRMQKVHGYVHDQGAAMLGGVSGHAGLFSTANDVAKMMQLYLWGGTYGGRQYLTEDTLKDFNTCYYCDDNVRRGVGFDKPQLGNSGPTCGCVSMTSFGHSGFTGTFTWADPEEELVYVFMSNRTYPNASNRKLIRSNLRSDIQEAIYEAIIR